MGLFIALGPFLSPTLCIYGLRYEREDDHGQEIIRVISVRAAEID